MIKKWEKRYGDGRQRILKKQLTKTKTIQAQERRWKARQKKEKKKKERMNEINQLKQPQAIAMCSKSHWRVRKHENPVVVDVVRFASGQCKEHPSLYHISVFSSTSTRFPTQSTLLFPPFTLQDPAHMYGLLHIDAQTVDSIYLYESVFYNSSQRKCNLYFHNLFVSRNFSGPDKYRFWISRLFHSSARHPATFPSKCINSCCRLCPFRWRSDLRKAPSPCIPSSISRYTMIAISIYRTGIYI